jgi:hypothetical protein
MGPMTKIRRWTQRWARRFAPLVAWYAVLGCLVFGADAALDWHRHSKPDGAFVHLHPHAGGHRHDAADPPSDDDHEPGSPSSGDGRSATLSLASGAIPAPAASAPVLFCLQQQPSTAGRPAAHVSDARASRSSWSPRGPPA